MYTRFLVDCTKQKSTTHMFTVYLNYTWVGLQIEEAADRTRWRKGERLRRGYEVHPATFGDEEKTGLKLDDGDCLAYTADDDSSIFVVETTSFINYCGFIFLLQVINNKVFKT